MKLIFAGTPEFAAIALAALFDAGHEIALVLTQPDRPAGRGMQLQVSPVKALALRHGVEVLQPLSLKQDPVARRRIAAVEADAMIVAAYGLILPQDVLDMPRFGCLNIHASLLPRWRGAAPIQRAIQAGDAETGVAIMQMEAGLDTGATFAAVRTPIAADDTAARLHDRLAEMGARLIVDTLARLPLSAVPQASEGITYADKINRAEAWLDWKQSALVLDRLIRAFQPFPIAQTRFQGEILKIHAAYPNGANCEKTTVAPGTIRIADKTGVTVACGEGTLTLTELQRPGGKRLPAAQFLAGCAALKAGVCFDAGCGAA
ncbi:MAG: methionyl-tRNA formyltransferase [Zoogloeaceae bacterium]|jgi:methionyl-tRNA formyltransferase|nr:methionyl-tRNA formyltransferase [Zoogloeaceae bacterium]